MDCILLAAGNSKRFGENKLLYPVNEKPMYRHVLDKLHQLFENQKVGHLLVVTQYAQIEEQLHQKFPNVVIVKNENPELGISFSIKLGLDVLQQISPESKACMFIVGDQPYIKKDTLTGFLNEWEKQSQQIAACANEDTIGNPVIFSNAYYQQLRQLTGDRGGKKIVLANLQDTFFYQISKKELEDIDVKSIQADE